MQDPRRSETYLVFDAVGTLIHPEPSVSALYERVGRKYGSSLTAAEISPRFRRIFRESETACFEEHQAGTTSEVQEQRRWRWIVARVLDDVRDLDGCFLELWDVFASPESWSLFEDVPATLADLRQAGYRLAIASNFDSRLHQVCAAWPGILGGIPILVSSELGYRKPDVRFYRSLMEGLATRPEAIVVVGDDLDADVLGPRRAGISSAWLKRHPIGDEREPFLTTLHDLPEWLENGRFSVCR